MFFFFLAVLILLCTGFSPVSESRGYSLVAGRGLLIVVASLMEHGPQSTVSKAVACTGLAAPWYVESSWIRDQTCVPCIGGQVLYHLAIWEAPTINF